MRHSPPLSFFFIILAPLAFCLLFLMAYLERVAFPVVLATTDDPILAVTFIITLISYLLVIFPWMKKRFPQYFDCQQKKEGLFLFVIVMLLVILCHFLLPFIIVSLPYQKHHLQVVEVKVQKNLTVQSGGSAPSFALYTSSWRGLPSERFRSEMNLFRKYDQGDQLTIEIYEDLFGRVRVESIEKLGSR